MFELKTTTECELTKFVGRTQKEGKHDAPAVSVYLKISNASNTMLDMLSPTMRLMAYAPIEGQEQLPGVEITTPVLRSPDMKHWKSETVHEGWKVFLARGIEDGAGLQMGSCKVDEFSFDLYQGGHVDCEFRISTADVDEEGAGMLWGRQKRKVFVQIHAPELPEQKPVIDGTVGHPGAAAAADGQASLIEGNDDAAASGSAPSSEAGKPDTPSATDAYIAANKMGAPVSALAAGSTDDGSPASEQPADPERGTNWPFCANTGADGTNEANGETKAAAGGTADDTAGFEAGAAKAIKDAGVKPKKTDAKPRGRSEKSRAAVE